MKRRDWTLEDGGRYLGETRKRTHFGFDFAFEPGACLCRSCTMALRLVRGA